MGKNFHNGFEFFAYSLFIFSLPWAPRADLVKLADFGTGVRLDPGRKARDVVLLLPGDVPPGPWPSSVAVSRQTIDVRPKLKPQPPAQTAPKSGATAPTANSITYPSPEANKLTDDHKPEWGFFIGSMRWHYLSPPPMLMSAWPWISFFTFFSSLQDKSLKPLFSLSFKIKTHLRPQMRYF